MIFLYLFLVYSLDEDGYLFSIKYKKYLHIEENKIHLDNIKSAFKIVSKNSISIHPLENMSKSLYYDNNRLYIDNGVYNGFRLGYFPDNMVRLEVGHDCLEVQEKGFIKTGCKEFEVEIGQYFRWIQIHVNREYLDLLTQNNHVYPEEDFIKNSQVGSNPPVKSKGPEKNILKETKEETFDPPILAPNRLNSTYYDDEKPRHYEPDREQRGGSKEANIEEVRINPKRQVDTGRYKNNQQGGSDVHKGDRDPKNEIPRENMYRDRSTPLEEKHRNSSLPLKNKVIRLEPQINLVIPKKELDSEYQPDTSLERKEMEEHEPVEAEYIPEDEEIPDSEISEDDNKGKDFDFFPEIPKQEKESLRSSLNTKPFNIQKVYVPVKKVTVTNTVTKTETKTILAKPRKKKFKKTKDKLIPSRVSLKPTKVKEKQCRGLYKGISDLFGTKEECKFDNIGEFDRCDEAIDNINKRIFKIEYFDDILS